MNNVVLYALTVLIWGTTWFTIKSQAGYAPAEISILYRAVLATFGLVAWCKINKLKLSFQVIDHIYLFLLGLSMFSLHYLFIYNATHYIVSGVVAVVFSSVSFFGIVNNYIFFKARPSLRVIFGAIMGVVGLCLFFWGEMTQVTGRHNVMEGFMLVGVGAVIFSLSSTISKRNNIKGLAIIPSMTMASIYGVLVIIIYNITLSNQFVMPHSISYWISMIYLAAFGSIVAVLCYLKVVKNIGPELAGYTTVLAPMVALIVSSGLEGYEWSIKDLFGLALVITGNVLVITKKPVIVSP